MGGVWWRKGTRFQLAGVADPLVFVITRITATTVYFRAEPWHGQVFDPPAAPDRKSPLWRFRQDRRAGRLQRVIA
jgi:hypothetical protein